MSDQPLQPDQTDPLSQPSVTPDALDQQMNEALARLEGDQGPQGGAGEDQEGPQGSASQDTEQGADQEEESEYELAANELRKLGFSNRALKSMSQRDVVAEANRVARIRREADSRYHDLNRKYLELLEQGSRPEKPEELAPAEPFQTSDVQEALQTFANEYLGEGADKVFPELMEKILGPLQAKIAEQEQAIRAQSAAKLEDLIGSEQKRLVKDYPRLSDPQLFRRLVREVDASIKDDPDAFADVEEAFDLVAAEIFGEPAAKSQPDRAARRNGQPTAPARKSPNTRSIEDRENAALAALEEFGDPVRARQAYNQ